MAKRDEPKQTYVAVTTRTLYCFPEGMDGRSNKSIVDEWFGGQYPMDGGHASRDGYRVGHSTRVIGADVIDERHIGNLFPRHSKPLKEKRDELLAYRDVMMSPAWNIADEAICDLEKNSDLVVTTNRKLVVGYLLKQLDEAGLLD